jgi:hypothetical protein
MLDDRCVFLTSGQYLRGILCPGVGRRAEIPTITEFWHGALPLGRAFWLWGISGRGRRRPARHTTCPDAPCGWRARMTRGAGVRCPHPVEPGAARGRLAQCRTARGQPALPPILRACSSSPGLSCSAFCSCSGLRSKRGTSDMRYIVVSGGNDHHRPRGHGRRISATVSARRHDRRIHLRPQHPERIGAPARDHGVVPAGT